MKVFELFGEISLPGMDKVNTQLDGLQGKVQKMAPALKKIGMGMTAAGGAIVAGFGLSMKEAADFETAMREVNTMMGLSDAEFTDFSKQVQALASDLGVDAVDSANALYQAISAGVPKENVLEFLEIATKAAIGGVTDTKTAVDGLTTVINAFKMPMSDAQKVADIMFTTVKGGKTTFDELSASLFQVAPVAAASGVSFEEVAAALATMTKQGVPTSVATTQLRQVMVSLQKPTADMQEVIGNLGYESGQTMLEELGLADTLNLLRDATGGSNEQLMKMFGSVEAGQAVLALTGENAVTFAEDLDTMAGATGAATDAFDEMEKSASRQMESLKSAFKDIQISIGNVLLPILKDIVDKIKPIIESIKKWIAENPGLTKTIVLIVGAVGGLLLVLGPILMMLPGIISLLPILGGAFAALMGPVGLIIAAIAALIAIGVLVWKNWDEIKAKAIEIWNGIKKFFVDIWEDVTGIFETAWNAIVKFFEGIPEKIGKAFETVKDWILTPFRAAWEGIGEGLNWLIDQINKIKIPEIKVFGKVLFGGWAGFNIPEISLPKFGGGGLITEPTLLYGLKSQRPYAIAGEAGIEHVSRGVGGETITNEFNIAQLIVREEADVPRIARELLYMQEDKVRARGG